jgi:hypothetical protein
MQRISRPKVFSALACLVLLSACSSDGEEELPAACEAPETSLRAALAEAPGEVRLDGTPISGCFVKSSDPSAVQRVGAAYLAVAAELGDSAARRPEGAAALRLGYLIGAVRRGSERTQGIHSELLRRLEQEASPVLDSAAFERGERAGRTTG